MTRNDEFVREAQASLRQLTNGLIELERNGTSREQVDELFRTAHTLKGNCSMAGLDGASRTAHAIEDLLSHLRDGTVAPNPDLTDAAIAAIDDIDAILEEWHDAGVVTTDPDSSVSTLRTEMRRVRDGVDSEPRLATNDEPAESASVPTDTDEFDPTVLDALESASAFGDLDRLVAEMDDLDEEDGEQPDRWGTFDTTDPTPAADEDEQGSSGRPADHDGSVAESDESSEQPADFDEIKNNVERGDISDLDRELNEFEFGEFDDDDELSIMELVEGEPHETDPLDDDDDTTDAISDDEPTADSSPVPDLLSGDGTTAHGELDDEMADSSPADSPHEVQGENEQDDLSDVVTASDSEAESPFEIADLADTTESDAEVSAEGPEPVNDAQDDGLAVDFDAGEPFEDDVDDADESDESALGELFETDADELTPDEAFETDADELTPDEAFEGDAAASSDVDDSTTPPTLAGDASRLSTENATEGADIPDIELPDLEEFGAGQIDGDSVESEPTLDASFTRDEHTVEFESRFADQFGHGPDDEVALVQASSATIEESSLDAARYQPSEPVEYPLEFGETQQTNEIQSITVDVQNADSLLNLVDELSVAQLRLTQSQERGEDIDDQLSAIESVTEDLRRTVMDLRLMPLSTVVDGLPRVVREVARQQDKQVSFEVSDEGVDLDRSIVEKLGDPLVHLVRNAVDHGIESPEERELKDKPPEGTVKLRAWREQGRVVIEVEDDGRGLSAERIRQQAVDSGVLSMEQVEQTPIDEMYDLVFEPGLSTSEEVTDVSGRGVGMDAVKRTVTSLDGTVRIESEPDAGTTVQVRLPISVAVSKMLFVDVAGTKYAIPANVVDDVQYLDEDALTDDGRVAIDWPDEEVDRPEHVSVVSPAEAFAAHEGTGTASSADGADGDSVDDEDPVLVRIDPDTRELALVCDAVGDAREVVVKPYEKLLGEVPGISGATMSGDGSLVNIIDVKTL